MQMKLNSAQVERALSQFEAQAIPDDHPLVAQLNPLFGDHTFFLDDNGLNIVEPAEPDIVEPAEPDIVEAAEPAQAGRSAKVVNLASWSDATLTRLAPH